MNRIRGKILNPDTNRYVMVTSRKGKQVSKKYKTILQKKVDNKRITRSEREYMEKILYSKFCKCTKTVLLKEYKKECPNKGLAYGSCTKTVYKNKGLDPPFRAAGRCRETFKWYK